MSKELKKTRYYTANYNIFHRKKDCSYLKPAARVFSFLSWEPVGDIVEYEIRKSKGVVDKMELYPCTRCGK